MLSFLIGWHFVSFAYAVPDAKACETVVSDLLQRKKEALDRRERTITVRENDLKTAEKRLQVQLENLSAMRQELRMVMKEMDAQQLKEVERLSGMFQKMRDKQAAGILEKIQDPTIAVAVLRRLPNAKAGTIMAAMNKQKAAELAELITRHSASK